MGKPALHATAADKVTGKAKYAGDIRVPGHALRDGPAAARPRRQAQNARRLRRPRRSPGSRSSGTATSSPPSTSIPTSPRRRWPRSRPSGTVRLRARRQEHLRPSAQERPARPGRSPRAATSRQGRGRLVCRLRRDLPEQLRRPRPHGDAHGPGQARGRTRPRSGPRPRRLSGLQDEIAQALGLPPRERPCHHRPSSAADSAARAPTAGRRRRPGWPSSRASPFRSPGPGPTSSSRTRSGRRRSSRSSPGSTRRGRSSSGTTTSISPASGAPRISTTSPTTGRFPSADGAAAGRRAQRPSVRTSAPGGRPASNTNIFARESPDRHHGREGEDGPPRVPAEEPDRPRG